MSLRGLMRQESLRRIIIVEKLYYEKDFVTSEELMEILDCSRPILLNDIRFLNEENLPIRIIKNKGLYSIEFDFHATIDTIYAYVLRSSLEYDIIESLFFEKNEKIQFAAKDLNCSLSNMQRYLIAIKSELLKWDIGVNHRPLQMVGDEASIRQFYYLFFKESRIQFSNYGFSKKLIDAVDQLIRRILADNHITNNMNVHFQLMHSFLIGLQRRKHGHKMKGLSSKCGLIIPELDQLTHLGYLIRRESELPFNAAYLRECLWPLYSHQLILTRQQQTLVHKKNRQLAHFYEAHHFLIDKVNSLLITPLSQTERLDTLRQLGNRLFCYNHKECSIEIIQETDKAMLKLIGKKYGREIRKLSKIVSEFLIPRKQELLISMYISSLITIIPDLLQRLVDADRPIRVLLLSDTSTSHERFWHSVFPAYIKGSVQYEYFESPYLFQEQLVNLTRNYDLVVTNVTMNNLVPACPLIAINTYPTSKDFDRIQQFINDYEPLPSRKELYNELTPSAKAR